jgi:UDP-glucose 4-epimerase
MKVAILGARGRLGRIIRHHLEARSFKVLAFSRNEDARHRPLGLLSQTLAGEPVDAILHMAWSTVPSTAETNPGIEWEQDLPLLASILRYLHNKKECGAPVPKLVFFSSCSVYGEPESDGQVLHENCDLRPKGWYARGKVHAEQLAAGFAALGIAVTILRVTNPYGFSQEAIRVQGVIPALVHAAVRGTEFISWGAGAAVKDYLHVSDLCLAVESVLSGSLQGTYNIAAGRSVSLDRLVALVESITGRPIQRRPTKPVAWDVVNGRYSHRALTDATSWAPKIPLEEGLSDIVHLVTGQQQDLL